MAGLTTCGVMLAATNAACGIMGDFKVRLHAPAWIIVRHHCALCLHSCQRPVISGWLACTVPHSAAVSHQQPVKQLLCSY